MLLNNPNDGKTTFLGVAGAALMAASINWAKLFAGDSGEIGKAAGALVVAALGYYTNKQ